MRQGSLPYGPHRPGSDQAGQLVEKDVEARVASLTEDDYGDDSGSWSDLGKDVAHRDSGGLERVLKEIESIAAAVARGDDTNAERYLTELVSRQTGESDVYMHAVKSLCNIAKKCAELFCGFGTQRGFDLMRAFVKLFFIHPKGIEE